MKVGDLVKRKPEWGEWVKHNPWMITEKDLQIGIIVESKKHPKKGEYLNVLWPNQKLVWRSKNQLRLADEAR